jgi:subtilase family serine protease
MKQLRRPKSLITAVVTTFALLSVVVGTFFFHGAVAVTHAAAPQFTSHAIQVSPKYTQAATDPSGKVLFTCQNNGAPVRCYGPNQIRQAYDIQRVLNAGINGAGSTIVIIDAFQSPTIRQDLRLFSRTWGLANPTLNIIAPDGLTPFDPNDPNQVGWSAEISLDVEWSFAIAPGATIDLVLAKSNQDADILSATKYAVDNNLGQVISQSFGEAESCMDPGLFALQHTIFQEAVKKGITLFASSGDDGAAQPTCDGSSLFLSASTPASDPLVTGVGGTYLNADARSGKYIGESAWNETDVATGASGGGFSSFFARPGFQSSYIRNPAARGVPDVAYNASVNGGVLVAWGVPFGVGAFFIFGGTSAGSPQWAGMLALVNQAFGRQGSINNTLYLGFAKADYNLFFHDITVGTNTFGGVNGYNTKVGWDAVTGLGSFDLGNTFFGPPGGSAPNFWA